MRVLIVEDEEPVAETLQEFLGELGHAPQIALTAESALDRIAAAPPDLIFLDLYLPGMNGMDFIRLLERRNWRIPVVAMSGMATESQARECLRLGAVDFVGKPVALERLAEVIACLAPQSPAELCGSAPGVERRRAARAPVALPVRVHEYNGTEWTGVSVDVSRSGIKVRTGQAVAPGPAAKLEIDLPDGAARLEVLAVLVRADLDGYAFHFANLTEWQHHRLNALVDQHCDAQPDYVAPHLRILQSISQALSRSLDVEATLRAALDALTRVTGHEIASLHLIDESGKTLRLRGDRGLSDRLRVVNGELPVGQGLIGRVAATGRAVHVADASDAPQLLPSARDIVREAGIRGLVCVPIRRNEQILGTLTLGRRTSEPFREAEIALLEAAAGQVGVALELARLYGGTRHQP